MRKILVPLDGSPIARWALPWALPLRAAADGELELVTVHTALDADMGPTAVTRWEEEIRREERNALESEADLLQQAGHPRPDIAIADGLPGPAIVAHAEGVDADLVIMATHGRGGLSRAWLGSVTSFVSRHASVPVLVVRPVDDGSEPDLRNLPLIDTILVPVDGSEFSEAALARAERLAKEFDAELVLLRASPAPIVVGSPYIPHAAGSLAEDRARRLNTVEEYLDNLVEGLDPRVRVRFRIDETEPAHAIPVAVREEGADMVVMATHGRGALMRAIVGSVADKVMRTSPVPVLLVRPEEVWTSRSEKAAIAEEGEEQEEVPLHVH